VVQDPILKRLMDLAKLDVTDGRCKDVKWFKILP
jgi:hypothetical protein